MLDSPEEAREYLEATLPQKRKLAVEALLQQDQINRSDLELVALHTGDDTTELLKDAWAKYLSGDPETEALVELMIRTPDDYLVALLHDELEARDIDEATWDRIARESDNPHVDAAEEMHDLLHNPAVR
jgi:hypothetical protein